MKTIKRATINNGDISFLADEAMLKSYQESIQKYGKRAREIYGIETLDIFKYENGVIKGSNVFANQLLAGNSLASPAEVLHASEINPEPFRGLHVDLGSVLRTNGDNSYQKNDYIAKDLFRKLKQRGITPTPEEPVMISSKGLIPIEDTNEENPYGLVYKLTDDDSTIVQDHRFSHEFNGRQFLEVDEKGIPNYLTDEQIKNLSGDERSRLRTFYAREDGLSRFFLDLDLDLDSNNWGLAGSYHGGRVAVKSV